MELLFLISKGNSFERGMLYILAKINLIFYKSKLVWKANVFYLVNADLVRRKLFALKFLVLHQL